MLVGRGVPPPLLAYGGGIRDRGRQQGDARRVAVRGPACRLAVPSASVPAVGADAPEDPAAQGLLQCSAVEAPDLAEVRRSFEGAAAPALPFLGASATGWQRRTNWSRDPYARGAYSCFRPGQLTRFAELMWIEEDGIATQIPAAGSLIFAGEHLSDAFPGYMEGGLQTGRLAARPCLPRSLPGTHAFPNFTRAEPQRSHSSAELMVPAPYLVDNHAALRFALPRSNLGKISAPS